MDEVGFTSPMNEFQETVLDYTVAHYTMSPFTNERPGYDWAAGFLKRRTFELLEHLGKRL